MERIEKKIATSGVKEIRVVNHYGNLRVRFGGHAPTLELGAAIQHLSPDRAGPTILEERDGERLTLRVALPGTPDTPSLHRTLSREERGRTDLVLLVPGSLDLTLKTFDGLIEVKKVQGNVDARSERGDIRISESRGSLTARTDHGSMTIIPIPHATVEDQHFTTTTGHISVYIREDADVVIQAATSGSICSDFSTAISHDDNKEPDKRAHIEAGRPVSAIFLESKRGNIRIERVIRYVPNHKKVK